MFGEVTKDDSQLSRVNSPRGQSPWSPVHVE